MCKWIGSALVQIMACHLFGATPSSIHQCWVIAIWALRNKLQWNYNQNKKLFIDENTSENIVCEPVAILSMGRWVKSGHWWLVTLPIGFGLGLQGYNGAANILRCFTIILQNQSARVDSITNLTKGWVFRFRLNASISSHNLISFGKQFHANVLAKSIMLEFWNLQGTLSIGSCGIYFPFWWGDDALLSFQRQVITWTNADLFSIGPSVINLIHF